MSSSNLAAQCFWSAMVLEHHGIFVCVTPRQEPIAIQKPLSGLALRPPAYLAGWGSTAEFQRKCAFALARPATEESRQALASTPFKKNTRIISAVRMSGSNYSLLRNCYKAKKGQWISQSGWGRWRTARPNPSSGNERASRGADGLEKSALI